MSAFAENPFFFIVDNNPSFLPGNILKDPRKIVELTDVACNTRRSSLSSLSVIRDSGVPAFLTKSHLKNEWDKIRNDMHDQSDRYKSRRDDYNMSNKNGFPGMYYTRESRKNSSNSQSPWTMNSRASPTIKQNYPRRKSMSKKTNQSTMGHRERDVWSRYWTDNTPGNYGKTHGKSNLDGYTILRNQYEPMRGRQGFESHRPAYQHGIQRGYPAGRSSKASTNANMSDGSRRGDSYMSRDRRTRWESMKSPMYDANLYMNPQQRRQSNFVYENLDDYSSERSDDSKRDRIHGSRIRSRTYSPPVDRAKYQLLRNQYNEDDDDEYFSMSTENFTVDDHARRNVKDIDGNMGRDAMITSQLAGHPGISETSSINLMLDISSSTLIGGKACYDSRDRVNRDNAWIFDANGERCQKRNTVYNDNHCSLNCCENPPLRVPQSKNDALSSRSKHGYETFSKKNLIDAPPRGSSYSVFPNKNSNENTFSIMKTVCAETNTDPLDFQKESFADARVLFTTEVSEMAIHKSESCNMAKEKSQLLKKPSSATAPEVNELSKISDDTSPNETNKKMKTPVGLINSTTAYLKRKFASSNEKNADEFMTSCHHSIKDDVKRRRAETASKLPIRISARNKSRNPIPNSPSFESHASKGGSTGDRATSPDPEDRSPRTRTKPRGQATSPYSTELSKSRQLRASRNDQSPYTKMGSNELQLHPVIASNPQESVAFSRRPIKSPKSSMKNQQRKPPTIDPKGKRESKYINLIRKPKQK